jgi:class 3 adenylate cyclase
MSTVEWRMAESSAAPSEGTARSGPHSHAYIHAAILFADIENSVVLSSTLSPPDYDELINSFQLAMHDLVGQLRELDLPIGEVQVIGDQLALFLYHPEEVERNRELDGPEPATGARREELIAEARNCNEQLVYAALRAGILLKNLWLARDFNLERVRLRREPLGLGIGIHYGRVYLRERPDGRTRIEGFTINLAKRIESFSRHGRYSHIMLSQEAYNRVRSSVLKHTQLRQRVFFERHEADQELMKGILETQALYELKFFSRIGIPDRPEVVAQYEALFHLNHHNIWAYYQLFEHYAYIAQDWERVYLLASQAVVAHPSDEKVLLDLSRYYFRQGGSRLARQYAEQALDLNPDFDLALEHLAVMAGAENDLESQVDYLIRSVALSPGSPINHLNLGLALAECGELKEAMHHLDIALKMYAAFRTQTTWSSALDDLVASGKLPPQYAAEAAAAE